MYSGFSKSSQTWYWRCNKFACVSTYQLKYSNYFVFREIGARVLTPKEVDVNFCLPVLCFVVSCQLWFPCVYWQTKKQIRNIRIPALNQFAFSAYWGIVQVLHSGCWHYLFSYLFKDTRKSLSTGPAGKSAAAGGVRQHNRPEPASEGIAKEA